MNICVSRVMSVVFRHHNINGLVVRKPPHQTGPRVTEQIIDNVTPALPVVNGIGFPKTHVSHIVTPTVPFTTNVLR